MGEEKEILLRGKVCAYLTCRLMGDADIQVGQRGTAAKVMTGWLIKVPPAPTRPGQIRGQELVDLSKSDAITVVGES